MTTPKPLVLALLIGVGLPAPAAFAQNGQVAGPESSQIARLHVAPANVLGEALRFSIISDPTTETLRGNLVQEALNYNLGVKITPIEGLNLSVDAWRQQATEATVTGGTDWHIGLGAQQGQQGQTVQSVQRGQGGIPLPAYADDSPVNEYSLDNPLDGLNLEAQGLDLGASYVWDSSRFGQFTLSTTTTYVDNFEDRSGLLELANGELGASEERMVNPELQTSLMLTWELGNHTASAITNYFDSFQDISELDVDEINEIVDNITTVDLQYGYSVKTGSNDRAIISFGIRNVFDEKTARILNSATRILDQNGRVAYGSIKYQF